MPAPVLALVSCHLSQAEGSLSEAAIPRVTKALEVRGEREKGIMCRSASEEVRVSTREGRGMSGQDWESLSELAGTGVTGIVGLPSRWRQLRRPACAAIRGLGSHAGYLSALRSLHRAACA